MCSTCYTLDPGNTRRIMEEICATVLDPTIAEEEKCTGVEGDEDPLTLPGRVPKGGYPAISRAV